MSRWLRAIAASICLTLGMLITVGAGSAQAGSQVNGAGSTYVYIAMRQWIAEGQSLGLSVNYTPQGSPTGLGLYAQSRIEFAGTEAEYASLPSPNPSRGHQYVPDVAGATAIMYNIKDGSGKKVDYLHLDPVTVARIYTGKIKTWADPAISKTNRGIKFPNQPIKVVLRGNQSGTTALFFDFLRATLGSEYDSWFTNYECGNPAIRPVLLQCRKSGSIPSTVQFNDSEQIAQFVSSSNGAWSIGFDEFGYAKKFKTPTAWIKNASGKYVLPYAQNISAALESAKLRSDLSQDLSQVYASRNPAAYPISAYSYLVTPCAPSSSRASCKGSYPDSGQATSMAKWMRYIACDGQTSMAALGYSPLPPNLSQEMANAIGRLSGKSPEKLSSGNCANPRFKGSLGSGASSPCDPFLCQNAGSSSGGGGSASGGGSAGASGDSGSGGGSAGSGPGSTGTSGGAANGAAGPGGSAAGGSGAGSGPGAVGAAGGGAVVGKGSGAVAAVGGGSDPDSWRAAAPVTLSAKVPTDPLDTLAVMLFFMALIFPVAVNVVARNSRRARARGR